MIREHQPAVRSVQAPFTDLLMRMDASLHVFVLTVHHRFDGWSFGVFFRELGALQHLRPCRAPFQYADYASWQRGTLSENALQHHLDYWQQKLAALPGVLDLPTDFPRQAIQGFEGAVFRFALPSVVAARLLSLSQETGASQFMTLLTVFKVLLNRYTHQPEIVVGTPVHTRNLPELEHLIGCFVNTLVLRTSLSDGITARELLLKVRETVLEGHAHSCVPFEKLVEVIQSERSLSHSALFQVAFNFQNTPLSATYETTSVSAMFDLSLFMWESAGTVCGAFEYSTDLFKESTVARMAEHLVALATAIAENPDRPVALLPLLSKDETTELLNSRNRTETTYARELTIPEFVSLQARRTPKSPAVIVPSQDGRVPQQVTYEELDQRSDRLADWLRSLGVGSQTLVGVCLDRSIDMVTALLGVLKSGGAYVPMDPHLPRERLAFMMEDAQLTLVLCEERFRRSVPPNVAVVSLDRDWGQVEIERPVSLEEMSSRKTAYVILRRFSRQGCSSRDRS